MVLWTTRLAVINKEFTQEELCPRGKAGCVDRSVQLFYVTIVHLKGLRSRCSNLI